MSNDVEVNDKSKLKNARHLTNLKVNEVSVVDKPAILRDFLVIKRLQTEDSIMSNFVGDSVTNNNADVSINSNVTDTATHQTTDDFSDLEKRMLGASEKEKLKLAASWLKKMMDSPNAPSEALKFVASLLSDLVAGRVVGKVDDGRRYPYPSPSSTRTRKGLSGDDYMPPALSVNDDGSVMIDGEEVTKARTFTTERTNTVKNAAYSLVKLLTEIDKQAAEQLLTSFRMLPKDPPFESQVRPVAPIQKNLEEENAMLKTQLDDVSKRLAAIEKMRSAPQSIDSQGGTDNANVNKNFWGGIL